MSYGANSPAHILLSYRMKNEISDPISMKKRQEIWPHNFCAFVLLPIKYSKNQKRIGMIRKSCISAAVYQPQ